MGGGDMLSVAFCISYDGRPWQTIILSAPSPEAGLLTLQQLINLFNEIAVRKGWLPRFSASVGACLIS